MRLVGNGASKGVGEFETLKAENEKLAAENESLKAENTTLKEATESAVAAPPAEDNKKK